MNRPVPSSSPVPLATAPARWPPAGSGSTPAAPAAPAAAAAPAGGPLDLAAGCPATVVMQQDWQPEAEHGAMY